MNRCDCQEKLEDIKRVIRSRKSNRNKRHNDQKNKNRKHNGQKNKNKQHNDQKKKNRQHNGQKILKG